MRAIPGVKVKVMDGSGADGRRRHATEADTTLSAAGDSRLPHRPIYMYQPSTVLTVDEPVSGCVRFRHGIPCTTIFKQ